MPNSHILPSAEGEPISDEKLELVDKIFELPIEDARELTVDELYEDPDQGLVS
jgi:hypothetical protein